MSYEVQFRTAAAQQTIPLSAVDYDSLLRALGAAAKDPFDPNSSTPTTDVHIRLVAFGVHVIGVASVVIDVQAKKLRVFDLRWVG